MLKLSQLHRALMTDSWDIPGNMARYGSHRSYNPVTSAVGQIGALLPPLETEIDPITWGIRWVAKEL